MAQQKEVSRKLKTSSLEKLNSPYILLVEDEPTHAAIMRHTIQSVNPDAVVKIACSLKEYRSAIAKSLPEIALIDVHLPDGKALEVLISPPEAAPFPIVVMTSSGDEKIAVKVMKAGALDYIVKSTETFKAIPHTIERVLYEWKLIQQRKQVEEALRESELRFRSLYENVAIGLYRTTPAGKILMANRALVKMLGYSSFEELTERNLAKAGFTRPSQRKEFLRNIEMEGEITDYESTWIRQDGSLLIVREGARAIRDTHGKTLYYDGTAEDITERRLAESASRHAEDALRESEEKFRVISENLNDVLFITDTKGIITYISPATDQIFGYKREDMRGRFLGEFLDAKELLKIFPIFENAIRMGKPTKNLALLAKRKDGNTFHAEIITSIIEKYGKVQGTAGVIRDISERKQAVDALHASKHMLQIVLDSIPAAVFWKNRDLNYLGGNRTWLEVVGMKSSEEVAGKSDYDLPWEKKQADSFREYDTKILKSGIPEYNIIESYRRSDGAQAWAKTNKIPLRDAEGSVIGVLGTYEDITERKRVEEALLKESNFNQLIIANAGEGICVCHNIEEFPNVRFTLWNEYMTVITGYSMEEINRLGWYQSMYPDPTVQERAIARMQRMRIGDNMQGEEWEITRADGQKRRLLITTRLLFEDEGDPDVLGVMSDITEHKQAEEAMRQMQKLEGLGTLAGGIAHDFNNILGIILAYNTSIKQFKNDTKKLDLATETIAKAVDRGKTLVQQILTFARKTETTFGAVNVNDVVIEIMTMIFETFPKVFTYAQNFEKGIPFINADRSQLYQALLNLCVNARDAMPNGGLLTINTRLVPGQDICKQYPNALTSDYVCIEVVDTGEGMGNDTKNRIFEPFFTTKEQGRGTGLGLAVVFGVIQTHKGFIDVESELGKGTTFRLYLPVSQAAESITMQAEETLEDMPGGTETLLLVEDEQMLMMSLSMILVEKGYKVIPAVDGLEAVNIFKAHQKDIAVVLTDLGLPKITGLEECVLIREINPEARIVVATGYLDPEMKQEFMKVKVQHFIYKPYDIKQVLKVVRAVLDGK